MNNHFRALLHDEQVSPALRQLALAAALGQRLPDGAGCSDSRTPQAAPEPGSLWSRRPLQIAQVVHSGEAYWLIPWNVARAKSRQATCPSSFQGVARVGPSGFGARLGVRRNLRNEREVFSLE